jgi:hypothetical protein
MAAADPAIGDADDADEAQLDAAVTASQQQQQQQPDPTAAEPAAEQLFLYTFEQPRASQRTSQRATQRQQQGGSRSPAVADQPCLQGLTVSTGDMLVLSADGMQVGEERGAQG